MGKTAEGVIFNIKRFSVHDGPGIRTSIFLKGCPLECVWCHNPEGISPGISIWHSRNTCIACGRCVEACPERALTPDFSVMNHIEINRSRCTLSGKCVEVCPTGAIEFTGSKVNVDDVMAEIRKDNLFYRASGGCVTITGGEPALQPEFTVGILKACKREEINTAVETCLYCEREVLEQLIDHVDLFIADMKIFDSVRHQEFTSKPNNIIRENLRYLAGEARKIILRIPLIKGITDSDNNKKNIEKFVRKLDPKIAVEYLNFNPLTKNKYQKLSIPFSLK